ncbi:putative dehydrogenase [Ilumatobacter fluminis]|uniref:Putative dehydrogenase n=1 Tax=Ilumatobacter fluminis TaxID=467091 RepID=A0A4R7I3H7_9ACTN|nr:Gfo/Idh/MocA family oxidoreductase [Ilumatobacter fluminis]TDT18131.1 putative dehydrogenase [Ilumatobacter fluminis]
MTDQLNIALIGSKFMGRAHSNAWLNVGRFFDVARNPVMHTVAGRNEVELREFAERWGWANTTTDWRTAVADADVDLIDIATPNHVHAEQAIAALEAGKHVVCEKPLAGTLADAEAMVAAAAASSAKTFVWYNYRRVPAVALAHRIVASGGLGRIYHARACYLQSWGGPDTPLVWRFQGDIAGSGAHGDLNAHIIDAVRFVTGEEIVSVDGAIEHTFITERALAESTGGEIAGAGAGSGAATGTSTVDDAVMFLGRLSGGGLASFEASRLATGYHNANRFEIHGERGALRFDFERMNELGFYDNEDGATAGWRTIDVTRGGDGHPYADAWWPDSHGLGYEHGFVNQAADIVAMLAGKEPLVPMPDFADALNTQRVLDAAIVSAREHRPVDLSR